MPQNPVPYVKVDSLRNQCGMNFISKLLYAPTIYKQIELLDYAFNVWGDGSLYGAVGTEDKKSQIVFTDTICSEKLVWPEIKAISHRGPVTKNRRYDTNIHEQKEIAVYILTWDVYDAWRTEYLKNNPEPPPPVELALPCFDTIISSQAPNTGVVEIAAPRVEPVDGVAENNTPPRPAYFVWDEYRALQRRHARRPINNI